MEDLKLNGAAKDWNIFDAIKRLDAETIIKQAGLQVAADGKSFICPDCGHGQHGDGIKPQWRGGILRWKCYGRCGRYWSNPDLLACAHGVDPDNPAEVARFLKDFYPEESNSFFFKVKPSEEDALRVGDKAEDKEGQKSWLPLYRYCDINHRLSKFLLIGTTWRGLTHTTLSGAKADYMAAKYHPELWLNDKRPAIIFPFDNYGFFWRSVEGKARGWSRGIKIRPYIAASVKTGDDTLNFVVEGIIDALSIKQVLADVPHWLKYTGILATCSASYIRIFSNWVIANYGDAEVKPRFCIIADNDPNKAGIYSARNLQGMLMKAGFKASVKLFAKHSSPKLDANDALQQKGAEALFGALARFKKEVYDELEVV